MARTAEEIEDTTQLAGARIDIAARIGWLLRTSRIAGGVSLRDLGRQLDVEQPLSPATLSRMETTGRRSGVVIDAYERGLGLSYGHLRAPIDVLCRTFDYAPADTAPYRPSPTLADFSAACAVVRADPKGADWLRFAEFHVLSPFGLPADDIAPLVATLASEVGRSTGRAYQLRYEALSRLRCSEYGDVVRDVVRRLVLTAGVQRTNDLLSAVTEHPEPDLVTWCGELLSHESWQVARAACLGIQNMRSVGGLEPADWEPLVPVLTAACDAAYDDPLRGPILSSTLACCPSAVRAAVHASLTRELAPPRRAATWTRSRHNQHLSYASALAAAISGDRAGEPMLARLLFELLYDFRATHVVTSSFLLVASPFADALRTHLTDVALRGPDEITRHGAAYALANLTMPFEHADPQPWLESEDPLIRASGLLLCGFAGVPVAADLLDELVITHDEVGRDALFAAGMAQQPELIAIAQDPRRPAALRAAATWWRHEGGRVAE